MEIKKTKAFTLVEIMIVVLIIGILMAIAVPQFVTARTNSRQKTVISNLRQIDGAKERWAMEDGRATGAACLPTDLSPAYIKTFPTNSPVNGTYLPNPVGSEPTFLTKSQYDWATNPTGL